MPHRYFIRAPKTVVSFFVTVSVVIVLIYLLSGGQEKIPFTEFIQKWNSITLMTVFLLVFGFAYPFIGYVLNSVPLSRAFSDADKANVIAVFDNANFELTGDDGQKLVFRHKNAITRFMRLYEDVITVDYSGDSLAVEGLRREVDRLVRAIAWKLKNDEDDG